MATRSVRARIETRSARLRLPPRRDPYWQSIERGLAVGYYRPRNGSAGSWWVRVRSGGAYRVEALATADDHQDADGETALSWGQAQVAARAWVARQTGAGALTVEGACRIYADDLRARKGDRAASDALGRFAKHMFPTLGERRLSDLTASDLRAWFNGLVRAGDEETVRRSKDTANRLLGITKAAFNLGFRDGRVADDRAWRRLAAFKGAGEPRKIILTESELQRLADACAPDLRALVLLGAWTGARLGELTAARVRDFDHANAALSVSGKTGGRQVPLPPDAVLLLRPAASGKRPNEPLLTTAGGAPWGKSLHQRPFARAVEKAGLDRGTTYYALRHSYISRALAAGVPSKAAADHCGTSATMVDKHYAKFIQSDRARYAAIAAPALSAEPPAKVTRLPRAAR